MATVFGASAVSNLAPNTNDPAVMRRLSILAPETFS